MGTDNRPSARGVKLDLRRRVLERVQPASVLDLFCGAGEMWSEVWKGAAKYIGCDSRPFEISEAFPRFVADNRAVLRSVDLSQFNVFDLDAYGSPWEQALIIARRRRWRKDELGAIVVTDGSTAKTQFGSPFPALTALAGPLGEMPRVKAIGEKLHDLALRGFLSQSSLEALHWWTALSKRGERGSYQMIYSAVIFRPSRCANE